MSNLMSKSTIYQRNEARRARTLALKDDPRPAAVRVMSGLPGFRIIFPAFQPAVARKSAPLVESDGTQFTIHKMDNETTASSSTSSWSNVGIAASVVAVASGGAFTKMFFGRRVTPGSPFAKYIPRAPSPVSTIPTAEEGAAMLALIRHRVNVPPTAPNSISQLAGRNRVVSAFFALSLTYASCLQLLRKSGSN